MSERLTPDGMGVLQGAPHGPKDGFADTVYIVQSYFGDESVIDGVYHILDDAKASVKGEWVEAKNGWYIGDHYLYPIYTIFKVEVL